jgi:hypothetical protein
MVNGSLKLKRFEDDGEFELSAGMLSCLSLTFDLRMSEVCNMKV